MQQLPKLRGCEVHSTVILSHVDEDTFRRLGVNLTCEPQYQSKKLYHKVNMVRPVHHRGCCFLAATPFLPQLPGMGKNSFFPGERNQTPAGGVLYRRGRKEGEDAF